MYLYPFRPMSPRRMALRLFPPEPPVAIPHKATVPLNRVGDDMERYVEYWLTEHFPAALIAAKHPVSVPGVGTFECDLLLAPPPHIPLRPRCFIIECKNYRDQLPHYFLPELSYRVCHTDTVGGWMFLRGALSARSLRIASHLHLRIMRYCPLMFSFIQLLP